MFRIGKRYQFAAAHRLVRLPDGHKCSRPHGHNYEIEVVVAGPVLDDAGMVMDFAYLDGAMRPWLAEHDHTDLGDCTAEELAFAVAHYCRSRGLAVESVRVWETPKAWAEYRP